MIIGVPKEIKEHEYRVSITPAGVHELNKDGHRIIVEESSGIGSGFSDEEYIKAGAEIRGRTKLFNESDLIVKVKEPLPTEYALFRERQALFTYLHLASVPELINMLLERKVSAFAYETLEINGELPLLKPMSEIAGKMAPVMAAYYLQKFHGGRGVLMTGAEGVAPAKVVILGAGTVGMGALQVAHGMGAQVTVLSRGEAQLKIIDDVYKGAVRTLISSEKNIEDEVLDADVLIGAVLVTGAKAPRLVSKELVSRMHKGSVIVDVSVDQGGCIETTRPSTHNHPVYTVDGVVHYTVANMPGAYPRTSTLALTARTLEYIRLLAQIGVESAVEGNTPLRSALNIHNGSIVHKAVAASVK